ncbi:MAG: 1-deoxy-D-xylulose-5-phosphate reductoisomerase, partial [Hyphomonas sp.]|nr:1-deoxy-D-xylulose-5-phosphate reductoisomerase [Hyphomonas sp.]
MTARRRISIMGSTGSIGTSALSVVRHANTGAQGFEIVALAAGSDVAKLAEQALEFRPEIAVVANERRLDELRARLAGSGIETAGGRAAVVEAAARPADRVLAAIVGAAGLESTLAAVQAGNDVAIA